MNRYVSVGASDCMILKDLVKGVEIIRMLGSGDVDIRGISYDSKDVCDGFLFTAIRGERTDGHNYLRSAVRNGARALLVEQIEKNDFEDASVVQVEDTKSALARISANFFGDPSKELSLVGITGTNGKTTISYLLESIWKEGGKNPGVIGTIEYRYSGRRIPAPMTTPESPDLMKLLRDMKDSGADRVVIEVSSHSLDRKRVHACHFDAAVFTNLTQDHLDYHVTMENYFAAKRKLFTEVLEASQKREKFAIINLDDPYGRELAKSSAGKIISYSTGPKGGDVSILRATIDHAGIELALQTPWGKIGLSSKLFGKHNVSNILAAVAAALALGASSISVEEGVSKISSVPGRLCRVENSLGIAVLVDYAHTPDALKNVLQAVRPLTPGKLILVFGCGGDRDPSKRPLMGMAGRELSDILIITSDNPRTEPPEQILDQIESGVFAAGVGEKPYFRITDRREAITKAIEIAERNDTLLIAGKGHENYQIIGTQKIHFDDEEVASDILAGARKK